MRAPDFLIIATLISSELSRRVARRIRSGPLYRWRYSGSTPEGLSIAPQDLRPADAALATEFYAGHFTFALETVSTGGESPFALPAPNPEWHSALHSFRWLRHLRAADTDLSQAHASALVADWIEQWGKERNSDAWRADITAARLIAWYSHAPLLVKNSSPENYRALLKSMARQSRYLNHNAGNLKDGYPRLHAMIALAYASLCMGGREKAIKQASRDLDREIERQVLPDGGHISRNPAILVEILADLLPLRQVYKKQGHSPSAAMLSAIDRMMAALRFFRHSNGDLAQFNGTGQTPHALMKTILRYDDSKGSAQQSAPQSGYERLESKNTVVLMDTGKPHSRSTAEKAMAGTLSFELSSGSVRFISNCGVPESAFDLYAPFARATAAHSTATVGDTSSSRFAGDSGLHAFLPSPLIRAPDRVSVERKKVDNYSTVKASHNGYEKRFGIVHTRELYLSDDGDELNGCDRFMRENGTIPTPATVTLRFHLPPTISASLLSSGHSIMIAAPNSDGWTFTCVDGPITLEESIQFSGPGQPRKSEQIVVQVNMAQQNNASPDGAGQNEVRWTLIRRKKKPMPRTRKQAQIDEDLPDLLDTLNNDTSGRV